MPFLPFIFCMLPKFQGSRVPSSQFPSSQVPSSPILSVFVTLIRTMHHAWLLPGIAIGGLGLQEARWGVLRPSLGELCRYSFCWINGTRVRILRLFITFQHRRQEFSLFFSFLMIFIFRLSWYSHFWFYTLTFKGNFPRNLHIYRDMIFNLRYSFTEQYCSCWLHCTL